MVEVNVEELVTKCNLSYKEAVELIGKTSTQGKILGVTTRPGLSYSPGLYITCTSPGKASKHYKVGAEC
jgi:hypothetical protein